ncbi:hypothetical protein ASPZODRAFT_75981 [Penicilliopsis zonata CBS 506.65]|uniref:Serine hydrolase domain-containing protein n=1 Tax=Penicilliopsis zonata CBS 506.65 TaxID=1073090 RepID=A0A1L9S6S2_9EURO|nr:hypothetical protein ASPZODRAFT_75981 [Penicilliopsis zonata CBS 506.65]OJJ42860.1 hypothetical protein ASPZODRAFT_75981 [Penicilliopsis zonata CBS 506.65]
MRILCLHGRGTSGFIFKSQTSSFRSMLEDLDIEFEWLDGAYPDKAAPGIDLFYDPPYYSFYPADTLEALAVTRRWLDNHLAQSGPYDAVMMFSQGCVVGYSALLHHEIEQRTNGASSSSSNTPPPFKAAIFICGGPPLQELESLGFHISDEVQAQDTRAREALAAQADSAAILKQGGARWAGVASEDEKPEEELRQQITGPYKVRIPTVHIYGTKDPRYAAGVQLSGLCDESLRRTFNHQGGHEIPRMEAVSRQIADMVRWALKESALV